MAGDAGEQTYLKLQLENLHVTSRGALQFVAGQPVTDPRDREQLAKVMSVALKQIGPAAIGLLLPAVQRIRA